MKKPTYSLKQAQADPKAMKKFIREYKGDQAESTNFDGVINSMMSGAGKPKAIQAASSKGACDDYT